MNTSVFETYESNVRSYCRSFPTVFTKAKGSVMTDEAGKKEPAGEYDRYGLQGGPVSG